MSKYKGLIDILSEATEIRIHQKTTKTYENNKGIIILACYYDENNFMNYGILYTEKTRILLNGEEALIVEQTVKDRWEEL